MDYLFKYRGYGRTGLLVCPVLSLYSYLFHLVQQNLGGTSTFFHTGSYSMASDLKVLILILTKICPVLCTGGNIIDVFLNINTISGKAQKCFLA